jgi:hypothetical protein
MVSFTALVLERNDLFVFEMFDHFARYVRSGNVRIADCFSITICEAKHVGEFDFAPGSRIELFQRDDLTRAYPVLFASGTNNRVRHALKPNFGKAQKLPHTPGNDKLNLSFPPKSPLNGAASVEDRSGI